MTKEIKVWEPELEDWGNVSDGSYKLLYELAKERFDETVDTSTDLTTKTFKLLTAFLAFVAALSSTISIKVTSIEIIMITVVLYLVEFILILWLLSKRETRTKGSRPSEAFPKYLDKLKDVEQLKQVYLWQLMLLEQKIEYMKQMNKERTNIFQGTLIYSGVLFTVSLAYILYHLILRTHF